MKDKQSKYPRGANPRVSAALCDVQSGPLRCVAQLATGGGQDAITAIWRNEVGAAVCTPPRGNAVRGNAVRGNAALVKITRATTTQAITPRATT